MTQFLAGLTWWQELLLGFGIFAVTFVGSLAAVAFILVKMPCTFFLDDHPRDWWCDRALWLRWTGIALKNLLGLFLVALGIVLMLPGVPGQGLLTILIGIVLLDFPGKRRVERAIVGRPKVLAAINRLRARYGQPPLVLETPPTAVQNPAPQAARVSEQVNG